MAYLTATDLIQAPIGTRVKDRDGHTWERIAKTHPRARWSQHLDAPWAGVPGTPGEVYMDEVLDADLLARYQVTPTN